MDNVLYTKDPNYKEQNLFDFEKAILELKRVLKENGELFITLPFGRYQNLGWFQQFDAQLLQKILEIFQPKFSKIDFYAKFNEGWQVSNQDFCLNLKYQKGR